MVFGFYRPGSVASIPAGAMTGGCSYAEKQRSDGKAQRVVGSIPTIVTGNRGGIVQW